MAHQSWPNTMVASAKYLSMISTIQSTPLYRNEEFLRDLYLEKQLSTGQIAREIRSARSTVKEALLGFGILMRRGDDAHRLNKGQLAYGERLVQGHVVPHLAEQKILSKIVGLRQSGATYATIAAWLNSQGHPTKNRARAWDRPTIYKMIHKQRGHLGHD